MWAALVALLTRQAVAEKLAAAAAPVVEAPAEAPVPAPGQMQPLDFAMPDFNMPAGSPIKALIDQMEKAFPVPSIKPDSDMASLQYAAGQRAVVDWVRMKQKKGQA
ncbi:hypothetical protein ACET7V_15755 [Aeromonas sanarellii]|uniref:hypothetical protein n=1 Tax=Aeromonas sanarellii TaxID=633415 RepID=UPI0038D1C3B9